MIASSRDSSRNFLHCTQMQKHWEEPVFRERQILSYMYYVMVCLPLLVSCVVESCPSVRVTDGDEPWLNWVEHCTVVCLRRLTKHHIRVNCMQRDEKS